MSEAEYDLACADHGKRPAAFVCKHLLHGVNCGFHWGTNEEGPDNPCPDAWCDVCEKMVQQEGSWNDRAVAAADFKVVCDLCYEKIRERHWGDDSKELKRLVKAGTLFLNKYQKKLEAQFKLSSYERYAWNQDSGQLVFSHRGQPRVIADVVFVGSISTSSNTWLWAWANESDPESVKIKIRAVRRYGEKHHILKLACPHWDATEVDGWEMTSVAATVVGGVGSHRTPSADGYTFMLLTSVNWAQ